MTTPNTTVSSASTIAWGVALKPLRLFLLRRHLRPALPVYSEQLASIFLRGSGIEIGALHRPMPLAPGTRVKYVDRMCVADLRKQYPELEKMTMVEPDIIDDGGTLATIPAASCDFVIASHFIEHAADPIRAVENMLRVVRVGGLVLLAIPDKRHTYDRDRPVTPFEHLLRDYREGPEWSRMGHYEEWVRLVDKATEPEAFTAKLRERLEMNYSIHHHVWTNWDMVEMFRRMRTELAFPFEIAAMIADYRCMEVTFVLRKLG